VRSSGPHGKDEDTVGPFAAEGKTSMRQWDKSVRGQSLVEFALVLPMFLLLLIGITEFGRAWMTRNILTGASREAVRIAAVQGNTGTALSRANSILSSAGIAGAAVDIADDGIPYGTCSVTVSYAFPVSVAGFLKTFGIMGGNGITLTTSTSMRKEF
jgi:Flp pilus assembly protein TadG